MTGNYEFLNSWKVLKKKKQAKPKLFGKIFYSSI